MNDLRQLIAWLLLALVAVVGAGAAALGVAQAPKNVPLKQAVANTLGAPNYTEVSPRSTPQGTQTDDLVWQAPDKLGGYVAERKQAHLRLRHRGQGVPEPDRVGGHPHQAPGVLPAAEPGGGGSSTWPSTTWVSLNWPRTSCRHGNTYTFSLTQGGQTGHFDYHRVEGKYVSAINLTVTSGVGPAGRLPGGNVAPGCAPRRGQGDQGPDQPSPTPSTGRP